MVLTDQLFWDSFFQRLEAMLSNFKEPSLDQICEQFSKDPWKILISTLISLRTRDNVTLAASLRLFELAPDMSSTLELNVEDIEKAIYPALYYKNKSRHILEIADTVLSCYNGRVPSELASLLALPGVGLKTANLTLALAFEIPAICVDVHVHRIFNRLGLIKTKTPDESEEALRALLPVEYWIKTNRWFVLLGQNICKAKTMECQSCPLNDICQFYLNTRKEQQNV